MLLEKRGTSLANKKEKNKNKNITSVPYSVKKVEPWVFCNATRTKFQWLSVLSIFHLCIVPRVVRDWFCMQDLFPDLNYGAKSFSLVKMFTVDHRHRYLLKLQNKNTEAKTSNKYTLCTGKSLFSGRVLGRKSKMSESYRVPYRHGSWRNIVRLYEDIMARVAPNGNW